MLINNDLLHHGIESRLPSLFILFYTIELQWLVYHGCFEFVLESLEKNSIAADLGLLMVIFFFILKMVYCVFSLESPPWGNSNENKQYTFILKKIEKIPNLPPDLVLWLTLTSSNYPCLEHVYLVPKVFEPLKFYCIFYFFFLINFSSKISAVSFFIFVKDVSTTTYKIEISYLVNR